MTKLTKYTNFKSLKLSGRSIETAGPKFPVQLPELEDFFNAMRQKMKKSRKTKNDRL